MTVFYGAKLEKIEKIVGVVLLDRTVQRQSSDLSLWSNVIIFDFFFCGTHNDTDIQYKKYMKVIGNFNFCSDSNNYTGFSFDGEITVNIA